ncbi:MAG: CHAT domain-containing protein, partial [Gammaproteobacteria bacterium]|nr:CHAT domain-containing protein [Gammaproteobacteria bacterium]
AAFARVPWEIARPASDQPALTERGLAVRVITQDIKPDAAVLQSGAVAKDEHIRVLMVYAEAFGSTPLAMRQERELLLNLFYKKILPKKRIQVDALCYGVTQSVLREQIKTARGYHILHWSGHGHHNLLQIQGEEGGNNYISGPELVQLFIESGGFIPQIVFLSACLSGTFVNITDWHSFHAAVTGKKPDVKETAPVLPDLLENPSGYTGTALELLKSGVPQVVAMRYEVGDNYARELAGRFYGHLFADKVVDTTESALALA